MLEVRAFREWKRRSLWFWKLVESCVVYGDRGYRGLGAVDGNVGVYNNGSTATLTATPNTGASFKGWSGDCSACGPSTTCQIVMKSDKKSVAVFDSR